MCVCVLWSKKEEKLKNKEKTTTYDYYYLNRIS